jgi:hypothetical protein
MNQTRHLFSTFFIRVTKIVINIKEKKHKIPDILLLLFKEQMYFNTRILKPTHKYNTNVFSKCKINNNE